MPQDFGDFDDDDEDFGALPDPEVARIVLELDRSIMRNRRAAALRQIVQGQPVSQPVKPSRVELLVLTALVLTYGPVLFGSDFALVLEQIAECGAVVLLQQVVFADMGGMGGAGSEDSKDRRIVSRLQDARPMFEALCRKFPEAFLADARALLKRFTTRT
ncbi:MULTISPECIES: hypothetical protein [Caballeronia]|uniref:Uncharacterized protein n=2 Tax=Caballeronia TaxID=1827195 RepID=A0AA37IHY9_9BURK|nr:MULTISPECIES: hypothetical protein [Caballeronia]EKS71639.1 hypothetical protein BURK_007361 [Burkholderia sp. SJ98]KDR24673.1 hypothetical protein BG60_35880 [Caballeronia zhejiangensis]BCQ28651.1 hypothetical protein NK8_68410 [Caballeronia sp. NK8]GJH29049.1 hypothetical protein CBA19CS42_31055 [Caballeronia novacaledonica]